VRWAFEQLGERHFFGRQPTAGIGEEYTAFAARHAVANGIAAGQQRCAARRAYGRGDVELRPFLAFGRHAIEVRRANRRVAKASQIAPPHIVAENHHNIRQPLGGLAPWRKEDYGEA